MTAEFTAEFVQNRPFYPHFWGSKYTRFDYRKQTTPRG
jgi:hypothetical protein